MKVISYKNIKFYLPIWPSIITLIALQHWHAPEWLYGVLGVIFFIWWACAIYSVFTQVEVDVIEEIEKLKLQSLKK